ncbi:MAG: 1-acyl-sn-glycerol-3-phosphate acyltransferase [Bacteroidaceae bacterium]|nr:1-acyl-sn-glycerol-3-phosphate acyltransferase [Bacteroidaceae bacterium]
MIQRLSKRILEGWLGYRVVCDQPHPDKYVIALAPHTSNWDFIIGMLHSYAYGTRCQFMMKKAWFFWPMGCLMRALGGIPVNRSRSASLTDQLAQVARQSTTFHLCITPEGTRKRVTEWKRGFYYIALKADIPILLYKLDYANRTIECTKTIRPNGDYFAQLEEIKAYYKDCQGKHPRHFSV